MAPRSPGASGLQSTCRSSTGVQVGTLEPRRQESSVTSRFSQVSWRRSVPAGPDSVVVAFGILPLALLGCTYWAIWCWHPAFPREYLPAFSCGLALFAAQTVCTLYSPNFIPSAARWFANALGFCVFLYLCEC